MLAEIAARRRAGAALRRRRAVAAAHVFEVGAGRAAGVSRRRRDRADYVARSFRFPVVDYANRALPTDARLYLAFLGTRSYHCRRLTYDYYFRRHAARLPESSDDAAQVLSASADRITT